VQNAAGELWVGEYDPTTMYLLHYRVHQHNMEKLQGQCNRNETFFSVWYNIHNIQLASYDSNPCCCLLQTHRIPEVCQPYAQAAFTPQEIFLVFFSVIVGYRTTGRIISTKNSSYIIGLNYGKLKTRSRFDREGVYT
jgi:hypothetical protein